MGGDFALCTAGGKDLCMAASTSMETQMGVFLNTLGQCGDIVVMSIITHWVKWLIFNMTEFQIAKAIKVLFFPKK